MNDTKMLNSSTNGSVLTFTGSLSDNGTDYYCTASVGAANKVNELELIIRSDTAISNNYIVTVESMFQFAIAVIKFDFFIS